MEERLHHLIEELGGKHGVLERLREIPTIQEYIVPTVLLRRDEGLTAASFATVRQLCDEYKVDRVRIRTSCEADWSGMIDTMPSPPSTIGKLESNLDAVAEALRNQRLLNYARDEGSTYDPDNVSRTISPFIEPPYGTLTEHPNQSDFLMIDLEDEETQEIEIVDCKNNQLPSDLPMRHVHRTREQMQAVLQMREDVRSTGLFPDDALQYEFGFHPTTRLPLLFQVRHFSKRNEEEWTIDRKNERGTSQRIFGYTKQSGMTLPVARAEFRVVAIMKGEQSGSDYILAPESISATFRAGGDLFLCPKNMRGYVPCIHTERQMALVHQNTRFVQGALRRDGFAILEMKHSAFRDLPQDGGRANVTCNGRDFLIAHA